MNWNFIGKFNIMSFTVKIRMQNRNTLGNSLAPIFAADFPPEAPKFNQRTFRVRLINLCTSDKKSSRKSGHKEFPRVLNRFFGGTNENSTGAHYKDV